MVSGRGEEGGGGRRGSALFVISEGQEWVSVETCMICCLSIPFHSISDSRYELECDHQKLIFAQPSMVSGLCVYGVFPIALFLGAHFVVGSLGTRSNGCQQASLNRGPQASRLM